LGGHRREPLGQHPHDGKRDVRPFVDHRLEGFVLTGAHLLGDGPPAGWPLDRPPMLFETGMPGVFAVGDVQHGSIKRVASAVGEGSVAIRLVHEYLSHR
jgi:thioredoxin reductase (NADPH)